MGLGAEKWANKKPPAKLRPNWGLEFSVLIGYFPRRSCPLEDLYGWDASGEGLTAFSGISAVILGFLVSSPVIGPLA